MGLLGLLLYDDITLRIFYSVLTLYLMFPCILYGLREIKLNCIVKKKKTFIARSHLVSYAFKLGKRICIIYQIKTCNDQAKLIRILI